MVCERIGELLGHMGKLSPHDIEEILHEQKYSGKRFGTIALSSGYCEPQDVWQAWCNQLASGLQRVNVATMGVDAQATAYVPRELAMRLRILPLRVVENELAVAVSDSTHIAAATELLQTLGLRVRFVLADAIEIERALHTYYPLESQRVAG